MTKLMAWLFFVFLFLSLWISLITKKINNLFLEEHSAVILYLPFFTVVIFGIYASSMVLWKVFTFNDCHESAEELFQQIEKARQDLIARGFQF